MAKIILTHDVPNLGSAGDVVTVKDGYARNYLVPRRLAERWTPGAQRHIDQINARRRKKEITNVEDAREIRDQLEAVEFFTVSKLASQTDALYGAVSSSDVAQSILDETGVSVDRRKVVIESAIKYVGDYVVFVNLHPEVTARITVRVIAE